MGREFHVRFCEGLGVRFPRATRLVLFGDNTSRLLETRRRCAGFLERLRLKLHPRKAVISRVCDGTRFLGYRIFPDHRRLPAENLVRLRRRLRRLQRGYGRGTLDWIDIRRAIAGWNGHAAQANTWLLREAIFRELTFRRDPPREPGSQIGADSSSPGR